jgi:hypothetical protein
LRIFLSPASYKMSSQPPPTGPTSLPLHLVAIDGESGALLRRRRPGPGRPRRVERKPDADGRAYADATRRALQAHVEGDPLVAAASSGARGAEVLRAALVATAAETASLAWELHQRPLAPLSERVRSRRLDALGAVARLVQIASEEQGAPPPGILEKLRHLFLSEIQELAADVIGPDRAAQLAAEVAARTRATS